MPPLEAVAIDPGDQVVALGPLSVAERKRLESEVDAVPLGAPPAGFGGASTSDGANTRWVMAGASFLALSFLASMALWRRRNSS